jgi:hypothetical protein
MAFDVAHVTSETFAELAHAYHEVLVSDFDPIPA